MERKSEACLEKVDNTRVHHRGGIRLVVHKRLVLDDECREACLHALL